MRNPTNNAQARTKTRAPVTTTLNICRLRQQPYKETYFLTCLHQFCFPILTLSTVTTFNTSSALRTFKLASMVKPKRLLSLLLRLIAFGSTLAAVIVMGTSHEKGTFFAISYEAKYSDTPAFKYFVIANAIVAVYGFLILFIPSESPLWRLLLALDLVFTMLLISSISAALAVAQVGKKGNYSAGWLPVCGQVTKYCNQVTGALAAGFIAIITYIIMLLYSSYTFLNPLLE